MRSVLSAWDKRFLWHPFTQQAEWQAREPVIIQSAKGVWLRDQRGRRFLDGNSSLWVNVWGHRRPELDRALKAQADRVAHSTFLGLTHEPAIRLARELIDIAPEGLTRVFYSDNGSTAVEVALKMAYQFWQLSGRKKKTKFVGLKEGYHGDTIGSVSVGGIDLFHARFKNLLFQGWNVDPFSRRKVGEGGDEGQGRALTPTLSRLMPGEGDEISQLFSRHHGEIAAVIMEPLIQGASGMRLMPKGYLAHVARLCRKYGVRAGKRPPRFSLRRQKHHRRLPAAGGNFGDRTHLPRIPRALRRIQNILPWPHLYRQPVGLRRRLGEPAAL